MSAQLYPICSSPYFERGFFMPKFTYRDKSWRLRKLVLAALFCALAFVSMFVMRINIMFLTVDAKDAVVALAGLLLGPIYSLAISLAVSIQELVAIGNTGPWGFLMDFLSTAVFSTTCALVYKYKKNMIGAVVGLLSSVVATTLFMVLFNIFITPIYMGVARAEVIALLPSLFLPFNLVKSLLNAALVLVLYKPLSTASRAVKLLPATKQTAPEGSEAKGKHLSFSIAVSAVGLTIIAICLVIFFVLMDGSFSWFK